MAPAIAHFLAGSSILLLFAAPFALRYDLGRDAGLWLAAAGGFWGLVPDFHQIAPVHGARLFAFHNSRWVDLFALHYTLDREAIRNMYIESVFFALLVFLLAVMAFSTSGRLREHAAAAETPSRRLLVRVLAVCIAAIYAAFAAGVLLSATARLGSVALLVSDASLLIGGLLLVPLGFAAGVLIAAVLGAIGPTRHRPGPLAGALAGVPIGLVIWGIGVALLVPLWLRVGRGLPAPLPYLEWGGLLGSLAFAVVFGAVYVTVQGVFRPPGRPPRGPLAS